MRATAHPARRVVKQIENFRSARQAKAQRQLETIFAEIKAVAKNATELISSRSNADLTTRLQPGSWSVAECLDHLTQTTNAFLPAIEAAIADAPKLDTDRRLRTGVLARIFIANLEPPYRLRFKVLAPLAPSRDEYETAWEGFEQSQARLSQVLRSATGFAIDEVSIKSPVYARFEYNIYGAFRMLAAHQRRHIWQIEQILKALDSSRASHSFPARFQIESSVSTSH